MQQIMNTINTIPLTTQAAQQFFQTYFDVNSWIDSTAVNAVIGSTDDWRQRHNLLWYIREGSTGNKLVFIPWDYDRLNDAANALTRGVLKGNAWWDVRDTATQAACSAPIQTPAQLAAATDPTQMAKWEGIYKFLPPDTQIPVTCDRITQLFALGYAPAVQQQIRHYNNLISLDQIRQWFSTWSAQIAPALVYDPDGPSDAKMVQAQGDLISFIQDARNMVIGQINSATPSEYLPPMGFPFGASSPAQFRSG